MKSSPLIGHVLQPVLLDHGEYLSFLGVLSIMGNNSLGLNVAFIFSMANFMSDLSFNLISQSWIFSIIPVDLFHILLCPAWCAGRRLISQTVPLTLASWPHGFVQCDSVRLCCIIFHNIPTPLLAVAQSVNRVCVLLPIPRHLYGCFLLWQKPSLGFGNAIHCHCLFWLKDGNAIPYWCLSFLPSPLSTVSSIKPLLLIP